MSKTLILIAAMLSGAVASANVDLTPIMVRAGQMYVLTHAQPMAFKVGDENDYNITLGSFGNGTMVETVNAVAQGSVTIEQIMDALGQKQDTVEVIDPQTGKIISITVNGQAQDVPNDTITVQSQTKASVTVPAGTYDCTDIKATDTDSSGTATPMEIWENPDFAHVDGVLQMTEQSAQIGTVTLAMTATK